MSSPPTPPSSNAIAPVRKRTKRCETIVRAEPLTDDEIKSNLNIIIRRPGILDTILFSDVAAFRTSEPLFSTTKRVYDVAIILAAEYAVTWMRDQTEENMRMSVNAVRLTGIFLELSDPARLYASR